MLIYKVLRAGEWDVLARDGSTQGAPVDVADGYVHFSTAEQLAGTLRRHFSGETGLILAAVDADAAGASIRWEPSRGGALFPHLYRPLAMADVVWTRALADGPDGPLPPELDG